MNIFSISRKGLAFILVSLIVAISSCSKKDVTPHKKTAAELISGNTFTVTKFEGSNDGTTWTTLGIFHETILFKADGTFVDTYNSGQQDGNWSVSADGKTLTYGYTDYTIVSVDESALVVIDNLQYPTGNVTYAQHRSTWTKQ
jgi:hypothetical protein